eukprot:TRINITY_DN83619_c0_g1_i1.p1 TRINITY_DN83619_c0_g1~~TRINITY_DN83619_c0_g1_i1.p1  ORF type:complete len:319 (+),score=119.83 TRINITY_DN83619_c0_g1_i1:102-1058(+)
MAVRGNGKSVRGQPRQGRLLVLGCVGLAVAAVQVARRAGASAQVFVSPGLRGTLDSRLARRAAEGAPPADEAPKQESGGFLEDVGKSIGKSLVDATVNTVAGMDENARNALLGKFMQGTSDFNDYLKFVLMMQRAGGAAGMMDTLSKIPGVGNSFKGMNDMDEDEIKDAETKVNEYARIIEVMTDEEKAQPGYFLFGSKTQSRIDRVVTESKLPEKTVNQFLDEYKSVKDFFGRFGEKVAAGKSQSVVLREMQEEMAEMERAREAKELREQAAVTSGGERRTGDGKSSQKPVLNPKRQEKKRLAKLNAKKGAPAKLKR